MIKWKMKKITRDNANKKKTYVIKKLIRPRLGSHVSLCFPWIKTDKKEREKKEKKRQQEEGATASEIKKFTSCRQRRQMRKEKVQ